MDTPSAGTQGQLLCAHFETMCSAVPASVYTRSLSLSARLLELILRGKHSFKKSKITQAGGGQLVFCFS